MDKPKIGLCKPEYLIDCIEISIIVHPQDCFSQRVPVNKFDYSKIIIKGIKKDGSKSKENHPFLYQKKFTRKRYGRFQAIIFLFVYTTTGMQ